MEWELVKPWVNRVGIVLEFLSFWFAAPEILGEERLRALERRVVRGVILLPGRLFLAVMMIPMMVILRVTLEYVPGAEFWEALAGSKVLRVVILVVGTEVTALGCAIGFDWMLSVEKEPKPRFLRIAVVTLVTIFMAMLWLLTGWESVMAGIAAVAVMDLLLVFGTGTAILVSKFQKRAVLPLVLKFVVKLADDKRIRQRSLAVGAVLFVVGFLLQIVATF